MINLAIDIGYGYIKAQSGDKTTKFLNILSYKMFDLTGFGEENDEAIEFQGLKYYVADKDKMTNNIINTRSYEIIAEKAPIYVYEALRRLGIESRLKKDETNKLKICTGISLLNYPQLNLLANALKNFTVNGYHFVCEVLIMVQGQGIFNLYQNLYPEAKEQLILIVDLGYYTSDILLFKNGKPLKENCMAFEQGAFIIVKELQKYINNKFQINFTEKEIAEFFSNKKIKIEGREIDLTDIIKNLQQSYLNAIINDLKSNYLKFLKQADKVLFSGGGAYFLEGAKLPDNAMLFKKPYEFTNVNGYALKCKDEK